MSYAYRLLHGVLVRHGGVTTLIHDDATGTDATSISGRTPNVVNTPGNNFVLQTGAITIASNKWALGTGRAAIDSGVSDCTVIAQLTHGSSNVRNPAILFRANTSTSGNSNAATSHWYAGLINGTGTVIVERNAGTATTRASSGKSISLSTAYACLVPLSGTNMAFVVDGVQECSYSSSFQQTATRHGIIGIGSSGTGVLADDFKVTSP